MRLQHQSVVAFHGRTRIADRHHARDVGRTAPVLAARINQQHTVAFDFAVVFRCRAVMRQGSIGIVAGDGVETWRNKAGTLAAVFIEHAVDVQLAQFAAVCQDLFKLGKEAAQCRAVFRHGIADMGDVGIGFNRFEECAWVDGFNQTDVFRQAAQSTDSSFVRINQQCALNACQIVRRLRIRQDFKACRFQGFGGFGFQTACIGKQYGFVLADKQMGQEHGVEWHIIAAQIGNPSDVVQRRNQMHICALLLHGRTDTGQFFGRGFRNVIGMVNVDFRSRQCRTVVPHFVQQGFRIFEADVFGGKCLFQTALAAECEHIGRRADDCTLGQILCQPLGIRRINAHFLQLDAVWRKLLAGLFPIAAVRPHACLIGGHHQSACRTGKAGKIAACLPMLGQVFGKVRIGGRNDKRVHAMFFHGFA